MWKRWEAPHSRKPFRIKGTQLTTKTLSEEWGRRANASVPNVFPHRSCKECKIPSLVIAVCGPVRAVCGPGETRPASYSIQWLAASDAWTSVAQAADVGFRTFWCCGGVAVLRKGCGGAAVVRSVVPPVDVPVGGTVRWSSSVVRSVVRSVVPSVVWFVVWSVVQFVVRYVRSVVRRNTSCSIQWPASFKCLDIGHKGLVFFVTFVILRSPDPGPCTCCPQNVVRAASWRRLWGSAQVHAAIVSEFTVFL